MRSREELAWAAGFFEGEGSFGARMVSVSQVDREPLERFQRAVGVGKIYGPYDNSDHGRKNARLHFQWRASSFEAYQAVLAMLWGWLSERRREQARRGILGLSGANSRAVQASRARHPRATTLAGRAAERRAT